MMRLTPALLTLFLLAPESALAKVEPIRLEQLATRADIIVVGRITRVFKVSRARIAEVEVAQTLKGQAEPRVYFLAQPTWVCDTSGGEVGEEGLLFLRRHAFDQEADRDHHFFREPKNFRKRLDKAIGDAPFYLIEHSGRGFKSIEMIDGERYVSIRVMDEKLLEGVRSRPEEFEWADARRAARLEDVVDLILRLLTPEAI